MSRRVSDLDDPDGFDFFDCLEEPADDFPEPPAPGTPPAVYCPDEGGPATPQAKRNVRPLPLLEDISDELDYIPEDSPVDAELPFSSPAASSSAAPAPSPIWTVFADGGESSTKKRRLLNKQASPPAYTEDESGWLSMREQQLNNAVETGQKGFIVREMYERIRTMMRKRFEASFAATVNPTDVPEGQYFSSYVRVQGRLQYSQLKKDERVKLLKEIFLDRSTSDEYGKFVLQYLVNLLRGGGVADNEQGEVIFSGARSGIATYNGPWGDISTTVSFSNVEAVVDYLKVLIFPNDSQLESLSPPEITVSRVSEMGTPKLGDNPNCVASHWDI